MWKVCPTGLFDYNFIWAAFEGSQISTDIRPLLK